MNARKKKGLVDINPFESKQLVKLNFKSRFGRIKDFNS